MNEVKRSEESGDEGANLTGLLCGFFWDGEEYDDGSRYDRWEKDDKFIVKYDFLDGYEREHYIVYTTKNAATNKRISQEPIFKLNDAIELAETFDT